MLSESDTNLRQPIELENQLLKHMTMDSEVGQSMLQLLQVRTSIWQTLSGVASENQSLDTLAELLHNIPSEYHSSSSVDSGNPAKESSCVLPALMCAPSIQAVTAIAAQSYKSPQQVC